MNVIKRQSIENWISLGTLVFALIGFILYAVNIGSAGCGYKKWLSEGCGRLFRTP